MTELEFNYAGIDVGSKELVVLLEKGQKTQALARFENGPQGHKKLLKYLSSPNQKIRVCCEATGIYHFRMAYQLSKAENVEVMVSNPRAVKHFGIASMQRAKTDPIDGGLLLQYGKRMDFLPWKAPAENRLDLQATVRRIYQLNKEIRREESHKHVTDYREAQSKMIMNDIEVNIRHLEKRARLMEEEALRIIQADAELKRQFELLISIKGIAKTSAIRIISELSCLPKDMQAEQWVAYTGLDPRPFESGSSVCRQRRISKYGNKYLRTALYMPALVAVQFDPHVKGFYAKLIARGKKPLQATAAVMRKLLHAIWGMFKLNEPWNGAKFYAGEIK